MSSIANNLVSVLKRMELAKLAQQVKNNRDVRLVAVSKTKTVQEIIEAYQSGHRHFGENYVQELEEKASSDLIHVNCPDIKWHFIGHLQSKKAKKIAGIKNLFVIETVDSIKLADLLNRCLEQSNTKLNIMIQINTSNEPQKGGIEPNKLIEVYKYIKDSCLKLNIIGLMTIGSYEQSTNPNEINQDFKKLIECRDSLISALNLEADSLEISMGMSHDFEQAIQMGSTNIRVGSLIFGSRN